MKKKIVLPILAITLLSIGAIFGSRTLRTTYAQSPTPTVEAPTTSEKKESEVVEQTDKGIRTFGMHMIWEADDAALAEKLGKTVEELTAARTSAIERAVNEAVAAGVITQTQADTLKEGGYFGWRQLAMFAGEDYAETLDLNNYLAEALGVSEEALAQAREEVRADQLTAAVAAGTITQEQADLITARQALAEDETFQSTVKSSLEAAINQAVTDGTITQSQADALIAQLSNLNFGRGMLGGNGFGGRGGMMNGRFGGSLQKGKNYLPGMMFESNSQDMGN